MKSVLLSSLISVVLLVPSFTQAQTVIANDDFEDGDFTNSPQWNGDTGTFTIYDDNGNNRLRLNDTDEGISYLSTSSAAAYGSWEFFLRLDGFSPSGSNNITVFLTSDITDLTGNVNGYALVAGESGSDDVFELIRYDGGIKAETIFTGTTNVDPGGDYQVKVDRSSDGEWTLSVSTGYGSTPTEEAAGTDNMHTSSSYFGFMPEYTSTRANRFYFDDITITKAPMELASIEIINNQELQVFFTDDLDPGTVDNSDFSIDSGIGVSDGTTVHNNSVTLTYSSPIPGGDYTLTVNGVSDRSGTSLLTNSTLNFSLFDIYADGDIVINEFMFDPPNGLPEYVEIRNNSSKRLNLSNWKLGDEGPPEAFSTDTLILEANEYMVISDDTTALFSTFGNRNYVEMSSMPALNNDEDAVRLYTDSGTQVDSLYYFETDWGGTDIALERRSATTPSIYRENWGDSPNASGGTPGVANDISDDSSPPKVTKVEIINNQTLQLLFSERVETSSAGSSSNYSLNDGIGINSAQFAKPDTVQLTLDSSLQNATEYTITVDGVEDIFTNAISSLELDFIYHEISRVEPADVFINEFMFDPPAGVIEYLELHNSSQKSLDLQNWTLNDNTGTRNTIAPDQFILPPDSFVVIAEDSSLFNTFSNFSLVVMGSDFPSLNNGGDDIVIRRADGLLLDSLRYSSEWGGDEVALERRTTNLEGFYRENWGDAPQNAGTPGKHNNISTDQSPPTLETFEILTATELQLVFSERITSQTATKPSNYSITEVSSIGSINFSAPDTVELTLQSSLQNAADYELTFTGLEDLFGNTSGPHTTSFTYYEISEAVPGEVFVNEFMFQPPAGETEFIELYNPTDKSFDLRGWTLNDNTGNRRSLTSQQFIIPPDSFVVIAPDSTLISSFPDLNLLTTGSRFPSLNNSGDDIVVRNRQGGLMDSLRYTSQWGGDEVSLERRTTDVEAFYRANWKNAPSGNPSPGSPNTIGPDQTPPELTSFTILDASTLQLTFSEIIERRSATNASNYSLNPSLNIQLISAVRDTVTLFLANDLTSGTTCKITIENLQDLFGNRIATTSRSREYLQYSQAARGDIVINEILYQRASATSPEFVELYNRSSKNFDLTEWELGDGTNLIDITGNIQMKAGSYVLLTDNEELASTKSNGYYLPDFPSLNDDEDAVYIRSDRQTTVDSLYYYSHWGGSDGVSIERKDPAAASNDASNWTTSESQDGFSAGHENSSHSPDEAPPEVIFSTRRTDGLIETRFDEFIRLTQDLSFTLDGVPLAVEEFDPTEGNRILLSQPSSKLVKGKSLNISIQNLTDVKGNSQPSASIPVAEPVEPETVVINEIMYNPLSESDDNQPDQSEYIELRNTENYAISLEGFTLHDAADENGEVRTLVPVNSTSKYLPAHGHLLVYADEAVGFSESQTAIFFELDDFDPNRTVRIDRGSLSLASRDDAIYLADSTGATIDSVYYRESWQNPNIVDTRGIALERINPSGPSNDAANWSSSTTEKGGTPGSENSIYQTPGTQPEEIGISFNPNPFSPDGDGHEDNLFINYKLDQPDYLLKVRIFDRYGRLVRELKDGEQAGYEGSLQWDGKTDDGNRNRIGIYIVLFEAYDSSNGNDRTFKEVVVLARQM